jgi:large subunit ribosomal protein L13
MRTTHITKPAEVERKWFVVDATDQTLGRLSTEVARILRGKHKPTYSPFIDTGDYVIIINAEKIKVTGKKMEQKIYVRHSGYVSGRKETKLREMLKRKPEYVLTHAVRGMMPKNTLGRKMLSKFHVYSGPAHKHEAQKPEPLTF